MGADLIVMYVTIDHGKKPDWAEGSAYIDKLAAKPWSEWPSEYRERMNLDVDDEEGDKREIEQHANDLRGHLKDLKVLWDGQSRDTVLLQIDRKDVLMTAGMSWGDEPTDAYPIFEYCLMAGVTKACGFDY